MTAPSTRPDRMRFRPDLEGLRGWAVIVVVLDHLWRVPLGGPLRPDLFFVLSGFLITRLLVLEMRRTGRIALTAYFLRRARRIVPVAVVVVVVTVGVAALIWYPPRAIAVGQDAVAALGFVTNWHEIVAGSSYLTDDTVSSPLLHFWSLAIEEQFYVVWPLVVGGALLVGRRWFRGDGTVFLTVVVSVLLVALCVASAVRTATDGDAAYFDTLARAWVFLPGALAAIAVDHVRIASRALRSGLVIGGVLLVAGALLFVDPHTGYPWPKGWIVVGGTVLIVLIGTGDDSVASRFLSFPPARWLGRISYSLYLWHLPVIVLVLAVTGRSVVAEWSVLVGSVVVGWVSYRCIERPIMTSARLSEYIRRSAAPRERSSRPLRDVSVVAVISCVLAGGTVAQYVAPSWLSTSDRIVAALGSDTAAADTADALGERSAAVAQAVRSHEWPQTASEQLARLSSADAAPAMLDGSCIVFVGAPVGSLDGCTLQPGTPATGAVRHAVVIGDSTAASWTPGLLKALGPEWRVTVLTATGCSAVGVDGWPQSQQWRTGCDRARAAMLRLVDRTRPDVVVLGAASGPFADAAEHDATPLPEAGEAWRASADRVLARFVAAADDVVVLQAPPSLPDPRACASRVRSATDCVGPPPSAGSPAWVADAALQDAAETTGARFVRTTEWFCADGGCPAQVGGVVQRFDTVHLTEGGSQSVAPELRAALR
ncbi:peptidoglycan/LPS O-acetylase OafA/YrhL [Curtobacterium sp. PhB170]|nr:peptidoglycan/LPS O-acetylase OafA/YrhL [Curtobacterium sp. PhB170]ROS64978.1 peptidoglycan/LPS O-acetylase OafA/YrhL [Curtobacterium sp. PhB141]